MRTGEEQGKEEAEPTVYHGTTEAVRKAGLMGISQVVHGRARQERIMSKAVYRAGQERLEEQQRPSDGINRSIAAVLGAVGEAAVSHGAADGRRNGSAGGSSLQSISSYTAPKSRNLNQQLLVGNAKIRFP